MSEKLLKNERLSLAEIQESALEFYEHPVTFGVKWEIPERYSLEDCCFVATEKNFQITIALWLGERDQFGVSCPDFGTDPDKNEYEILGYGTCREAAEAAIIWAKKKAQKAFETFQKIKTE